MDNCEQIFEKIDSLLSDESKWIKGSFAKQADGKPFEMYNYNYKEAVQWCIYGALLHVTMDEDDPTFLSEANMILWKLAKGNIVCWNDDKDRSFADVKLLIKEAIAASKVDS